MKKNNFSGKNLEEAKILAMETLNCKENEFFFNEMETKGGLFKSKKVEIEVITKEEIILETKNKLEKIINLMGIKPNFEIKEREGMTTITIFSDNNNILIGKQGRTIEALSIILKQCLYNELGFYFPFNLDVSEYKQKHKNKLERLAKNIAKDVIKTKTDVKLDSMNSYERRVVHTVLSEYNNIKTESIGEEPNRAVVIKYVESK
ncbi:MAG: RNA-binding cell elongation regulator Jag/EloR [Bacilli bacterium]